MLKIKNNTDHWGAQKMTEWMIGENGRDFVSNRWDSTMLEHKG